MFWWMVNNGRQLQAFSFSFENSSKSTRTKLAEIFLTYTDMRNMWCLLVVMFNLCRLKKNTLPTTTLLNDITLTDVETGQQQLVGRWFSPKDQQQKPQHTSNSVASSGEVSNSNFFYHYIHGNMVTRNKRTVVHTWSNLPTIREIVIFF
jgi:hypothetical protein